MSTSWGQENGKSRLKGSIGKEIILTLYGDCRTRIHIVLGARRWKGQHTIIRKYNIWTWWNQKRTKRKFFCFCLFLFLLRASLKGSSLRKEEKGKWEEKRGQCKIQPANTLQDTQQTWLPVNHLHSSETVNWIVYLANASNQRRQGSRTKSISASNGPLPGLRFQLLASAMKDDS